MKNTKLLLLVLAVFVGAGVLSFFVINQQDNERAIRDKDWAFLPAHQQVQKDELYKYFVAKDNVGNPSICYHIQLSQERCLGGIGTTFGMGVVRMDVDSFQVHKKYYNFSKDTNRLYYAGFNNDVIDSLNTVDFASLEVLNKYVFKDKNSVYTWDTSYGRFKPLKGFDLPSLQGVSDNILKDKNGIYISLGYYSHDEYKKFQDFAVDAASFAVHNDSFATDNNSVFLLTAGINDGDYPHLKKVDGADPATFTIIELAGAGEAQDVLPYRQKNEFAKDKSFAYFQGQKIEGADPKTFQPFEFFCKCTLGYKPYLLQEYSKDAHNVFYMNKKVEGADLESFEPIGFMTAKDKNHVYDGGEIMVGADPKTYEYVIAHD